MSKLYNTQENIATSLNTFFTSVYKGLTKVHFKILPYIIIGMVDAESVVTNDIIKKLKGDFQLFKNKSNRRFFNSETFDIPMFYHCIIKRIISNFYPHKQDPIHISFDYYFCILKTINSLFFASL